MTALQEALSLLEECRLNIDNSGLLKRVTLFLEGQEAMRDYVEPEPVAYAVYGIGAGNRYLHSVHQLHEEWEINDQCLGEHWAGNEGLYTRAHPSEAVPDDSSMPKDIAQAKRWVTQLRARIESLLTVINAPVAAVSSAPSGEVEHGFYSELLRIQTAMEYMGDQLNNMDVVEEDDEKLVTLGFDALNRLLAAITATKE